MSHICEKLDNKCHELFYYSGFCKYTTKPKMISTLVENPDDINDFKIIRSI